IKYSLKVVVEKRWSKNYKTEFPFTVINPTDVNQPAFQNQVRNSVEKTLCCCLCRSGIISIDARTDWVGYCSGGTLVLWVTFNNQSARTVTPRVSLHQIQTFFARGKSKQIVNKHKLLTGRERIKGKNLLTWDGTMLKLPDVCSSINNCSIIKVEYFIQITLHIPFSTNLSLLLPITIGT
ncbi:hypothetical protein HELRODRAFT_151058, partial [Helobdella robusta]|uniref:Arrestin C-terminal-like domain-containing protein n=1 Tax=Helobdella robusta TaxID=6412 RepID=T1EKI5_HELRO